MKNKFTKIVSIVGLAAVIFFSTTAFKSDFFEIAKQIEIFTTLFKELNMNYVDETNPAELMGTAIKAMLQDLDPYTHYWSEQDIETAKINNSGEYTGIGAAIRVINNKITIVEAFKDSPADKAGLKAGDEILKIGNTDVTRFKQNAKELLKGSAGSKIELTFKRQGEIMTSVLTRGEVEINAVPYHKLLKDGTGYIVLSRFSRTASEETKKALQELKEKGATKIILDLRGNPGGLLSEAINVSNLFLPKGELITTTKSVVEKYNQAYHTNRKPVDTSIPLAVLINGRSASASEIVAGALQDLDRAVIIGGRSFGKGLVQRVKELTYGTQLKITISRYYTPSGRCIQAMNYRDRDNEGNAIKRDTEDYNVFTTRNGRKVFDGGGILPDIIMETSNFSGITKALLKENAIFDFATQYYYSHSIESPEEFSFTPEDYSQFKNFIEATGFDYQTTTESKLAEVLEIAEEENLQISEELQSLDKAIETAKKNALEERKSEIKSLLSDEIIKRYFYKEGLYEYYVMHNPEILKAKEILGDSGRVEDILN